LPIRFVPSPKWTASKKGLCLFEKGLSVNYGCVKEGVGAVFPQIAQPQGEGA